MARPLSRLGATWRLYRPLVGATWRHHPVQAGVTLLAIALGVALAFAVQLINRSALDEFGQAMRSVSGQPDVVLRGRDATGFAEGLYARLADDAGVAAASPVVEIETLAVRPDGSRLPVQVLGIDAFVAATPTPDLLPRARAGEGRLAGIDPAAAFLNPAARRLLGQAAAVTLQVGPETRPWRDAGDVTAGGPPLVVMDIAGAQAGFGRVGRLSRIDVTLLPGTDAAAWARALALPADARVAAADEAEQRLDNLSRAYRVNLGALALVALFTGGFLAFSVQSLAVAQRVPELALLGVLGMPRAGRRRWVLAEAAALGLLGGALGVALGSGLAWWAMQQLGGDLGNGQLGSTGTRAALHWHGGLAALGVALGVAVTLAGAWLPARAAERLSPAQGLKGLGTAGTDAPPRAWVGPVLLAAGAGLATLPPWGELPLAAYAAVAALLLGGIACVPATVGLALSGLPLPHRALPRLALARADDARALAGAAVAGVVASLALAVAMTVMVASFRDSVDAWLGRLLPADLYVRSAAGTGSAATVFLPRRLAQDAATLPGVRRVEAQRIAPVPLDPARPAPTLVVRPLPDDTAQALPLIGTPLAPRAGLPNVFASEGLAALYDARPGRTLELPLPRRDGGSDSTQATPVFVRGLWRDYARQHGAVVMDERDWRALTGDDRINDLALWLMPGADVAAVQRGLRTLAGGGAALEFATTAQLRATSLAIFDRSFAVTRWLQAVAIGIGLVGIATSVWAQVLGRRKELGVLLHLGLTRRQLLALVTAETAVWTAAGTAIGLLLGGAIALVLVKVVNPQSFHWTMDLSVPWSDLAILSCAVLAAGAGAAWIAALAAGGRRLALSVKEDW